MDQTVHHSLGLTRPRPLLLSKSQRASAACNKWRTNLQNGKNRVDEKSRNSSGDEIANVNFLYDDIVHALQNTIDSCINSTPHVDTLMCWNAGLPNSVK